MINEIDIFVFIMSSTLGKIFTLTTFGESHGIAIGGVLDGCPSGLDLDLDYVQKMLDRRKPGVSNITSERKESDKVEFLSGLFEGKTLGTPIGFIIKNKDAKSKDYSALKDVFRPSHADYTYDAKYGVRDYRGGGRSSARETANWVVAGAIASQILLKKGISIYSYVSSIGSIDLEHNYSELDLNNIYTNPVRCPSEKVSKSMVDLIKDYKLKGDTLGGCISTVVKGVSVGLGEPVFDKLNASISRAIMSINACRGIEFGSGFLSSQSKGSVQNDIFISQNNNISTKTNHSGGIQGGISNGNDIFFRSAFKPVSSISLEQETITKDNKEAVLSISGRHDPCVVPRAVPIVESLTAMVILDHFLLNKTTKISDL